jgi:hypothetical protein
VNQQSFHCSSNGLIRPDDRYCVHEGVSDLAILAL